MERELFNNNKIVEALCQFTFKPLQDNTIFGQYWNLIQAGNLYSVKENISALNFSIASNNVGITPSLGNAMKYSNEKQDKIIQLHNNNISVHHVKNYQKWEVFKEDIDYAFQNFTKIATKTIIERLDIRAINVFEFPMEDFKLCDYFNICISLPPKISNNNSNTNITLEFPLENKQNFLVLRLNTSIKDKVNIVVLDLSFVNIAANIQGEDFKKIDDVLEYGHNEMHNLFTSVITDKTKSLIK